MSTETVPLGTHVRVIGGFAFPSESYSDEGIPVIRISDIQDGFVSAKKAAKIPEEMAGKGWNYQVEPGDILIAMSGATTGKIGVVADDFNGPFLQNQRVGNFRIADAKKVDKVYLRHYLTSPSYQMQLRNLMAGAAQPNISSKQLESIEIPLPPLPEQKRIAAILDKADSIRRKRQDAVRLTEELLRSVFLDMFGDPVTNPKGWVYKKLDELCKKITDGEHLNPTFVDDGFPIVMANNVRSEGVIFDGVKYVSKEDYEKFTKKCKPVKNDILVVSRGATIGRCTVVDTDLPFCLMGSTILLKTDNQVVLPAFLNWLLQHPAYQAKLYKTSSASAQQAIYLSHIKELSVPIPPIKDQQKFSDGVSEGKKVSDIYSTAVYQSDILFNTLLQRAFKGEL